jgi:putative ABC transport system permease protein
VIRVALKNLAGRKLRAVLTALAIVLGVAMVSGTYILTDTIKAGFNTIFSVSYENTSAVITNRIAFTGGNNSNNTGTFGFPDTVLAKVQALPDVEAAVGSLEDQTTHLVGRNGKVISTGGAPNLGFSHDPSGDKRFNPLTLVSGQWPTGPTEVVIDKATADKKGYKVGDTIGVQVRGPVQQFHISGIGELAAVSSIGGATLAIFDVPTAQRLFGKEGKLDIIRVAAKPGVPTAQLVSEIDRILPPTAQVTSAAQQAKKDAKATNSFLNFLQYFLLAFGGVALFVGAFVIANTLSITIAQRTREFATLRTLGASRRQVLGSVFLESLVIGTLASIAGLFLGLGLAKALNQLFVSFGIDLPKAGTVFAARTIVVSLAIGILVTMIASLRPAFRATSVPPIAAVREGSVLPPHRWARWTPVIAIGLSALGILLLVYGLFVHHIATTQRLLALGVGVLVLFVGVALIAPKVVRPLARLLGWPGSRVGGTPGKLARENTQRDPQRTASTAAALMIGLALVTFVAVLGAGLRSSFESAVNQIFHADYALTSQNNFSPLATPAAEALRKVPGVLVVSGVRAGDGRAFGKSVQVTAVEPTMSKVIRVKWVQGSAEAASNLGTDGAFVDKTYAKNHHLALGSPIRLQTPTGKYLDQRLQAVFDPPKGGSPFGQITVSTKRFDSVYPQPANLFTFVNVEGGVTDSNTAKLEAALKGFPDAKIATESQFKKNQEQGINILLNLLYVLLGLSIIVSLFGIVNTLVLTIFERTRELGMMRAVGMTRRQVRRMIRYESVITALIGAALGIPLGILLAVLVTHAVSAIAIAIPVGSIIAFVIAAIVVGLLAAILPARRAARLNVLEALQYE